MKSIEALIADLQCPGCVSGPNPKTCPEFDLGSNRYGSGCANHHPGTNAMGLQGFITFTLGMPKGFDREANGDTIRIWEKGAPAWDHLNVPVWYLFHDDLLFVRTFCPRIAKHYVDVIQDTALGAPIVGTAIDVGLFQSEID